MTGMHSVLYTGQVRHRRFSPKKHNFQYSLYMVGIDPTELTDIDSANRWFGYNRFAPVSWYREDFLRAQPTELPLNEAVWKQIFESGGELSSAEGKGRVLQLAHLRCFGLFFSPVNFYFAFNQQDQPIYMLAEVTNTPWLEQHYYLVNLRQPETNEKVFPVSPFMNLDMKYHWRVRFDQSEIMIHIENHTDQKVFDATLQLKGQPFGSETSRQLFRHWPVMTLKVVAGIYWQALRLLLKGIPFIGHLTHKGKPDGI